MILRNKFLIIASISVILLAFASCSNPISNTGKLPDSFTENLSPDTDKNTTIPENSYMHIKNSKYTKNNLSQFLQNESREELSKLSFYTNEPIQVSISDKGNLEIRSYAPINVKDVEIYAKEKGTKEPYTQIALYDEIYGFSFSSIPLTKQTKLTKENAEFKVLSKNDPFLKKIETIKVPLKINFAQGDGGPWAAMTPKDCRNASLLGITMSYMFNHKDYEESLKKWNEGDYKGKEVIYTLIPGVISFTWLPSAPFKKDDGTPLSYQEVKKIALGKNVLTLSLIKDTEPAGGIGGGNMLGLRSYILNNFTKYQTMPFNGQDQKQLRCYTIDVIFHEFAHCLGFYHPDDPKSYLGTMTYGGGWTTFNYTFLNKLIENNDLPVPLDGKYEANINFPKL